MQAEDAAALGVEDHLPSGQAPQSSGERAPVTGKKRPAGHDLQLGDWPYFPGTHGLTQRHESWLLECVVNSGHFVQVVLLGFAAIMLCPH